MERGPGGGGKRGGGVQLTHQTLALLTVLHPGVSAAVGEQAVLVQTLAAKARVALWTAEQVGCGVLAVTHHPPAHHLARLHTHTHARMHTSAQTMTSMNRLTQPPCSIFNLTPSHEG